MNILILGDSWASGTPSLNLESGQYKTVENTFFSNGHNVYNKSKFGGSNLATLNLGLGFLKNTKNLFEIDLIVWLYTEVTRDKYVIDWDTIDSYESVLDQLHDRIYNKVLELKKISPKSKWAIIGGQAPVYKPFDYNWADFLLEDWQSELVGFKLPESQCLVFHTWLLDNKKIFGLDTLEKETEKYEIIMKTKKERNDIFFDEVHPSNLYNTQLANRILSHFKD